MNSIKAAILHALKGQPVSSLYAKPKRHCSKQLRTSHAKQKLTHVNDEPVSTKGIDHIVRGYKNKAQCETLRDNVWAYIVPRKNTKLEAARKRQAELNAG